MAFFGNEGAGIELVRSRTYERTPKPCRFKCYCRLDFWGSIAAEAPLFRTSTHPLNPVLLSMYPPGRHRYVGTSLSNADLTSYGYGIEAQLWQLGRRLCFACADKTRVGEKEGGADANEDRLIDRVDGHLLSRFVHPLLGSKIVQLALLGTFFAALSGLGLTLHPRLCESEPPTLHHRLGGTRKLSALVRRLFHPAGNIRVRWRRTTLLQVQLPRPNSGKT